MILWQCGKTMQVGNFLLLNVRFFCCQVKMTEHQTTHFSTSLYYTYQQLSNCRNNHCKCFILLKVWITLQTFNHGSDFLCFLEWMIDWLIDWLTDWLTNDQLTNESINQQTDWLNIFIWLLLVLWITCILGMHFKFKIKCYNLSRSANAICICFNTFLITYYCK